MRMTFLFPCVGSVLRSRGFFWADAPAVGARPNAGVRVCRRTRRATMPPFQYDGRTADSVQDATVPRASPFVPGAPRATAGFPAALPPVGNRACERPRALLPLVPSGALPRGDLLPRVPAGYRERL